jgi:hypothetical protein
MLALALLLACSFAWIAEAAGAQECLDDAVSVEDASSTEDEYAFDAVGDAVDARGVAWDGLPGHAIHLIGGEDACFSGGDVAGPYHDGSVYECSARHCPDRVCPEPCLAYHTTAALAPAVDAAVTVIDDFRGSDYGDGISLERESGDVLIRRAYLHDIRDDAVESDWGRHSVAILDSLFDRVAVGLATRQRKKGASKNSLGEVWELRSSLIRLQAFPNTYRMEPGHAGFFKADRKKKRQVTYRITGNVFFAGPLAVEGSLMFPVATRTEECANNVLFWSGTVEAWEALLDDGDGYADKLDNRGRLAALNAAFPDCYDVVVKPGAQSEADFVAQEWTPRANAWLSSHPAGGL